VAEFADDDLTAMTAGAKICAQGRTLLGGPFAAGRSRAADRPRMLPVSFQPGVSFHVAITSRRR
jgi:hypothetical protein